MGVSENVVYPIVPNGFADHYPVMKNGYFIGNIPYFQTNPYLIKNPMLDVGFAGIIIDHPDAAEGRVSTLIFLSCGKWFPSLQTNCFVTTTAFSELIWTPEAIGADCPSTLWLGLTVRHG